MRKSRNSLIDPATSPVVRDYLDRWLGVSKTFHHQIHPADEMYRYGLASLRGSADCAAILYYLKGYQIFRTVSDILSWRFGGPGRVRSFLDFASGFGRFTRFLIERVPPSNAAVSEIDLEAIEFQRDYLGLRGWPAPREPERFAPGERFDCILAASLFSHLPSGLFHRWLARLRELLSSDGLLLFSVHGEELLAGDADWSDGIVFFPQSETDRLDPEEYGTSYVTEAFVRDAASRAGAEVRRFRRGLCGEQDLYVLAADGGLEGVTLGSFAYGDLDQFRIEGDPIVLAGWVRSSGGPAALEDVQLVVGGNVVARSLDPGEGGAGFTSRALREGRWHFEAARAHLSLDEPIWIRGLDKSGLDNILAMGTLRPFFPDGL